MSTLALAMAAGLAAAAAGAEKAPQPSLMVCLDPDGRAAVIDGGRAAASRVFQRAGIRLVWRDSQRPCLEGYGIVVTVALGTPYDQHRGALAYALPYERTHIVLMYDRVLQAVTRSAVPSLLGYTLAHEIGHMLEGVTRHSDSGVMKARWDYRDYADMQLWRLRFAQDDIDMMLDNLSRNLRMAEGK